MARTLKPGDRVLTVRGEKGTVTAIESGIAVVRLDNSVRRRVATAALTEVPAERVEPGKVYQMDNGQIIKPLEFVNGKWKVQLWKKQERRWGDSPILIEPRLIDSTVDPPDQNEQP